jgi:hypothetical protein
VACAALQAALLQAVMVGTSKQMNSERLRRGWFLTRQFENEANADIHSRTTAREIVDDFKGETLDYWVTGYGTGGTLKGVSRVLAKEMPDTRIIVCEPEDAPLLASGIEQTRNADGSAPAAHPAFKPHPMQGWTPDFIPKLTADAMATGVIDRIIHISGAEAIRGARPEGRDLRRNHGRRDVRRCVARLCRGTQECQRLVHAARHRRALSKHALVRQRAGRHDCGRARHLPLDAERAVGRVSELARGGAAPEVGYTRIGHFYRGLASAFCGAGKGRHASLLVRRRRNPGAHPHEGRAPVRAQVFVRFRYRGVPLQPRDAQIEPLELIGRALHKLCGAIPARVAQVADVLPKLSGQP